MVNFGEYAYFVVCKLAELGSLLEFIQVHHLNCIQVFGEFVLSPVHVTILAFPHALHQHIVFHLLIHQIAILALTTNYNNGLHRKLSIYSISWSILLPGLAYLFVTCTFCAVVIFADAFVVSVMPLRSSTETVF